MTNEGLKMVHLRYFFSIACFATAFAMTVLWLYKYLQDEDIVQFEIKSFDYEEGEHPMLSFCLINPFIKSKLKKYDATLTGEEYTEILSGSKSYNGEKNINFDDVTLNLADFLLWNHTTLRKDPIKFKKPSKCQQEKLQVTYSGFAYEEFMKCFGLKLKCRNIKRLILGFNSSVYPDGIRPSSYLSTAVALHLPNQLSLAGSYFKYTWPKRNEKKKYSMDFNLQQIDLLKRRNKRNDPCTNDLNFDQVILDDHLQKIGCKAPYQRTNKSMEICDSIEKIRDAKFDLFYNELQKKPCTSASTLSFSYNEYEYEGSGWFRVILFYPNQYRKITLIQAIDLHTLIGNAGAYVGLFLGKNLIFIEIGDYLLKYQIKL